LLLNLPLLGVMCRFTVFIWLACLQRVHAQGVHVNDKDVLDNLVDKLVDKLAVRVLNVRPSARANQFAQLPQSVPLTRSTIPFNPLSRTNGYSMMPGVGAPSRSVQAQALTGRREAMLAGLAAAGLLSQAGPASADLFRRGGTSAPAELRGSGELMAQKAYGTCVEQVQNNLRWDADRKTAERIDCYNRQFAEFAGYWERTNFLSKEAGAGDEGKPPVTFYDSVTGKPLFVAPQGRSWKEFVAESKVHGWPSFRDNEVVKENVRVLADGETVSVDGTHLGHNLPDGGGNRYCINLVSVAGRPV